MLTQTDEGGSPGEARTDQGGGPQGLLSPSRPKLAGTPTWKDSPQLVLPRLQLVFYPDDMIGVQFMFPSRYGQGAFSWVEARLAQELLPGFLAEWRESPEDCLWKYYALEAPRAYAPSVAEPSAAKRAPVIVQKTLEELDL